jgi:hypothetical protein
VALPSSFVVCCGGLLLGIEGAKVVNTPIVVLYLCEPSAAGCTHTAKA